MRSFLGQLGPQQMQMPDMQMQQLQGMQPMHGLPQQGMQQQQFDPYGQQQTGLRAALGYWR